MRVIAGTARSLKLKTPEGQGTRPTTVQYDTDDCSRQYFY